MRHHGKSGKVLMDTTGSGVPVAVGSLDAWDLDMSTDKAPVTSFGDKNQRSVIGLPAYKGTFAGNWDDAVSTPWVGRKSDYGVIMYLYPDVEASPTKFAWGPAWVDMKISTSAGGPVKISGTFEANGDWTDTF